MTIYIYESNFKQKHLLKSTNVGITLKSNIPLDVYILLGLLFQSQLYDFRITFHIAKD